MLADMYSNVNNTSSWTVPASVVYGFRLMDSYAPAPPAPQSLDSYVANYSGNSVSVVNTADNKVTDTIPVGQSPRGIAVSSDGGQVYVANRYGDSVSAIDTKTNKDEQGGLHHQGPQVPDGCRGRT